MCNRKSETTIYDVILSLLEFLAFLIDLATMTKTMIAILIMNTAMVSQANYILEIQRIT